MTRPLPLLAAASLGLAAGLLLASCAGTGTRRLGAEDFLVELERARLVSSAEWRTVLGVGADRAYLELERPALLGGGTSTTVLWTPLHELPPEVVTELRGAAR